MLLQFTILYSLHRQDNLFYNIFSIENLKDAHTVYPLDFRDWNEQKVVVFTSKISKNTAPISSFQ